MTQPCCWCLHDITNACLSAHIHRHTCGVLQPASPLHGMRVTGEGWLLGAALLQRPHLLALHQLLIKGLFNQDTQLITVQVNAPYASHTSGLERTLISCVVRCSTWLHKVACLTHYILECLPAAAVVAMHSHPRMVCLELLFDSFTEHVSVPQVRNVQS